ncbi:MAG: hypothetical protein IKS19_06895 [Clostridia bacterium]|nr:hypothetical protein [Clostridia bacterium]
MITNILRFIFKSVKRLICLVIIFALIITVVAIKCSRKSSDSEGSVKASVTKNIDDIPIANGYEAPSGREESSEAPSDSSVAPDKTDTGDNSDPEYITDPYTPTDHAKLTKEVKQLCERYPDALTLDTIGESAEDRELYMMKLGKGKKEVLFVAGIHGTEYIACAFIMRMTEEYAKAYEAGTPFGPYDVRKLLDETTIYIVPMANPDGVERVQHEGLDWRANANGVNLNLNFPTDKWEDMDRGVYGPDRADYKGDGPASEPETKAIVKLCDQHDFDFALSFHTKGQVLYWIDNNTGEVDGARELTDKIADYTGYKKMRSTSRVNDYGGGLENWFRYKYKRPGICVEMTPSNGVKGPHNDADFDRLVWDKAKYIGLVVID